MTRTLLVITGASRGFGRAVAQAFAETTGVTHCCLLARSREGLAVTRQLMPPETTTSTHCLDLGNLDTLDAQLDEVLESFPTNVDKLIVIQNAGTIGEISPVATATQSLQEWQQTVNLNVTSMFWTTRRFAQWAVQAQIPAATLVNISSLVAIQAFPSMALYSAGKAVRSVMFMFHTRDYLTPHLLTLDPYLFVTLGS